MHAKSHTATARVEVHPDQDYTLRSTLVGTERCLCRDPTPPNTSVQNPLAAADMKRRLGWFGSSQARPTRHVHISTCSQPRSPWSFIETYASYMLETHVLSQHSTGDDLSVGRYKRDLQ